MHRVFNTTELVFEIFSHLHVPQVRHLVPKARHCLLALALTSKLFTDAALSVLWYHMVDLRPLFKILSNFIIPSTPKSSGILKGTISQEDLQRFNEYAARVRAYEASSLERVSTSAYLRVLHANGQIFLLPKLRSLRLTLPSTRDEVLFLLHPGLKELEIIESFRPKLLASVDIDVIFQNFPERCPMLGKLVVNTYHVSTEILSTIAQMQHLTHFEMELPSEVAIPLSSNFFSTLSSSSNIKTLAFGGYIHIYGAPSISPSLSTLPVLTSLNLCIDIDTIHLIKTAFLGATKLPVLEKLVLMFFHSDHSSIPVAPDMPALWTDFYKVLRGTFPRLIHLNVETCACECSGFDLPISPLIDICSTNLKVLDLSGHHFLALEQADLTNLSKTAPAIERLRYHRSGGDAEPHGPELLIDIACTLPSLTTLVVDLNPIGFATLGELPMLQNGVTDLEFLTSTCDPEADPVVAALFLYRLFPNLRRVDFPLDEDGETPWGTTEAVLRGIWGGKEDDETRREIATT